MNIDITLEQALAKATPSLRRKMEYSVDLLRNAEKLALKYDSEDGYWLGFSGGKDSQALFHIAQLAGVKFKAFFSPTSVDPAELIRFIRANYPEVKFNPLTKSIYDEFIKRKCLPSMRIRWCCAEFKEKGGEGKVTLVGVRKAESVKRSKRQEVEVTGHKFSGDLDGFDEWSEKRIAKKKKKADKDNQFDQFSEHNESMVTCVGGKDKIVVSPILEWSDQEVWEFLNKVVEVPHCQLYDEGQHRIGCIACPMASKKNILKQIERWPYVKEKWIKAIMEVRRQGMVEQLTPPPLNFFTINGKYPHPQGNLPIQYSERVVTCRHTACVQRGVDDWGGAINLAKTTPRTLGGFSNSVNDDCASVDAENKSAEDIEREIAEAIFDWWISKKPYKEWYAEKYAPRLFDDNDLTNFEKGEV